MLRALHYVLFWSVNQADYLSRGRPDGERLSPCAPCVNEGMVILLDTAEQKPSSKSDSELFFWEEHHVSHISFFFYRLLS